MNSPDPRESPAHAALYAEEFIRWAAGHMRCVHEEAIGLAAYASFKRILEKIVIM